MNVRKAVEKLEELRVKAYNMYADIGQPHKKDQRFIVWGELKAILLALALAPEEKGGEKMVRLSEVLRVVEGMASHIYNRAGLDLLVEIRSRLNELGEGKG